MAKDPIKKAAAKKAIVKKSPAKKATKKKSNVSGYGSGGVDVVMSVDQVRQCLPVVKARSASVLNTFLSLLGFIQNEV